MAPNNHVNVEKLKELVEAIRENSSNAKITPMVAGEWIFKGSYIKKAGNGG